jgi:flagellar protein FliT
MSIYENVAVITEQMVGAAQEHDWQLLAKLEESCSAQVQAIRENDKPVQLVEADQMKKVNVIKKILADDRKIRDITQPRMAQLSEMMRRSSTQSKLARAYQLDHRSPG